MTPRVGVTGVLVGHGRILLCQQHVTESSTRRWSLPGGTLEFGESIEHCLLREMKEETALTVKVGALLHVADRISARIHARSGEQRDKRDAVDLVRACPQARCHTAQPRDHRHRNVPHSEVDIMRIAVRKIDRDLPLPLYARSGDAGLDLFAAEHVSLRPGERAEVRSGSTVAIPDGYAGFVQARSGRAAREGLGVLNAPGLVDSGYRGEIKIIAVNLDPTVPVEIKRRDRIAQMVILKVERAEREVVDSLPKSERGESGHGSTGRRPCKTALTRSRRPPNLRMKPTALRPLCRDE